jgi:hypothetical protein
MGFDDGIDGLLAAYDGPLSGFVEAVSGALADSGASLMSMEAGADGAITIIVTDRHTARLSIGTKVEATADDMAQPFHALLGRLADSVGRMPTLPDLLFTIDADGLLLYVVPGFVAGHIESIINKF